jgi:hypothetical protein
MTGIVSWYTPETAKVFLYRSFALSGLNAKIEESERDGVRAVFNLRIEDKISLQATVQFQGPSLRFIVHNVVAGRFNRQARDNHWLVNQAPWYGRVYQSPDNDGTDLSLGIPAPPEADRFINLEPYLCILLDSAKQLRAGQAPTYTGPGYPDKATLLNSVWSCLQELDIACVSVQEGQVLLFDTYTQLQREARVELFTVDQVLVARAHAQYPPDGLNKDICLDRTETVNQLASAGALSYDDNLNNYVALTCLFPALQTIGGEELFWLIQTALDLLEAAFTNPTISNTG